MRSPRAWPRTTSADNKAAPRLGRRSVRAAGRSARIMRGRPCCKGSASRGLKAGRRSGRSPDGVPSRSTPRDGFYPGRQAAGRRFRLAEDLSLSDGPEAEFLGAAARPAAKPVFWAGNAGLRRGDHALTRSGPTRRRVAYGAGPCVSCPGRGRRGATPDTAHNQCLCPLN